MAHSSGCPIESVADARGIVCSLAPARASQSIAALFWRSGNDVLIDRLCTTSLSDPGRSPMPTPLKAQLP